MQLSFTILSSSFYFKYWSKFSYVKWDTYYDFIRGQYFSVHKACGLCSSYCHTSFVGYT